MTFQEFLERPFLPRAKEVSKAPKKRRAGTPALQLPLNSTGVALARRGDCPLWERVSVVFVLIILAIFPLVVGSDTYDNITATKFCTFGTLACLYMAACVGVGIAFPPGRDRNGVMRALPLQRLTVPQTVLLAYMVWAVICALASPYEDLWLGQSRYEGLCSLLLYGAVFLLTSFWAEYTDGYLYGLGVMAVIMGIIALAQSFGSEILYPEGLNYWSSSFLTTIGHEDCVAGFVNILLPALLCGFVILRGRIRYTCLPGLFLFSYITGFTDVDTAKMGLIVVVLLLPCLVQSRDRLWKTLIGLAPVAAGLALAFAFPGSAEARHFDPGRKAAALLLGAAALVIAGILLNKNDRPWAVRPSTVRRGLYGIMAVAALVALVCLRGYSGNNRLLAEVSQLLHGNLTDEAGTYRGYIWKSALKLIGERPILGGGPGSFYTRFLPYNDGYNAASGYGVLVDLAHNDFLNIGVCTGVVGMLLYAAFLVTLAVRCVRRMDKCPVLLIFLGGMLGYVLYSFFVFSIAIVSPLFWVMAGAADKCVRQTGADPSDDSPGVPPSKMEKPHDP